MWRGEYRSGGLPFVFMKHEMSHVTIVVQPTSKVGVSSKPCLRYGANP